MDNNFEKDVIERLSRIEEQNKTQFNRIEQLEKTFNGNGHPGILSRLQILEDRKENDDSSTAKTMSWVAIIVSAAAGLVQIFFKQSN